MTQRPRLRMVLLGIALAGTGITGAVFLAQQLHQADNDHQLTCLIKWGNPPVPTPDWVDMVSRYDLAAFSYGVWDTPAMQQAAKDIRRKNLDIHLGTYFSAFTAPLWCRADAERGGDGWGARWWRAVSPYIAYGVDGDTATVFNGQPVFNVLLPEARDAAIGELSAYVRATGITWVMIDFMSVPLDLGQPVDIDLDNDGLGQRGDTDEQAALKAAWYAYARELRAALGGEVLLIPNGSLAMTDPQFSKLVDGCYVEGFGKWFYGSGDAPNYGNALDPAYGPQAVPNLCAPGRWSRRPGYVMLEDYGDSGKLGIVAALWDGCVEMRRSRNDVAYPPYPVDMSWLGAPTGPAVEGTTWGRLYENGSVTVGADGPRLAVVATQADK